MASQRSGAIPRLSETLGASFWTALEVPFLLNKSNSPTEVPKA
jgi:hypothetical protein